jgi:hypothetical protein
MIQGNIVIGFILNLLSKMEWEIMPLEDATIKIQ